MTRPESESPSWHGSEASGVLDLGGLRRGQDKRRLDRNGFEGFVGFVRRWCFFDEFSRRQGIRERKGLEGLLGGWVGLCDFRDSN